MGQLDGTSWPLRSNPVKEVTHWGGLVNPDARKLQLQLPVIPLPHATYTETPPWFPRHGAAPARSVPVEPAARNHTRSSNNMSAVARELAGGVPASNRRPTKGNALEPA